MKATIILLALVAIAALASAGRSSCSRSERNENRNPPQKADDARKVVSTSSQPGPSHVKDHEKVKTAQRQWNANAYFSSNQLQRRDAKEALLKSTPVLRWRSKNGTSLLDVGSGCGDVTNDIVMPMLPANFARLIGIDVSNSMVEFAREKNFDPRISFEQFDIGLELEKQMLRNNIEPFDHIASIYCLHWVHNQKIAIENLYKLLKPGGDMFLIFLVQSPLYDTPIALSKSKKWSEYLTDIDKMFSPYTFSEDPVAEFSQLLTSKGFIELDMQMQEKLYTIKGTDSTRKLLISLDAFYDRIPENRQNEYLDQYIEFWKQTHPDSYNHAEDSYTITYKIMIVYAKKASN